MIQGSEEWIEWRQQHLGASDLPVIMGVSKWRTPYDLWREKMGFLQSTPDNYAMKRGRELEPLVRDLTNSILGTDFEPCCVQHSDVEWAAASLDGYDEGTNRILEIKCPSLADHKSAEDGKIPEHYYPQVQWQMFVADVPECVYASYHDEQIVFVQLGQDLEYITNELLPKAADFWKHVTEGTEPERTEKDVVIIDDPMFQKYANQWKAASEIAEQYKAKEKYFRDKLVEFTDDGNCEGYGVRCTRVMRQGSVEWQKLWEDLTRECPDVKKFDPDDYRKEQIGYWKLSRI